MAEEKTLFLHEEIMLLFFRARRGAVKPVVDCSFAISAALLAELLLNRRIIVADPHKKKMVDLNNKKPLQDPLLKECLKRIAGAKRRASLQTWAERFAALKDIELRAAVQLSKKGFLEGDKDTLPLIIKGKIRPRLEPEPERELIERLRGAMFSSVLDLDPRTAMLISLAFNTGLLKVPVTRKKLKARQARIGRIIHGELMGGANRGKGGPEQAAVVVACIMPAVFASLVS